MKPPQPVESRRQAGRRAEPARSRNPRRPHKPHLGSWTAVVLIGLLAAYFAVLNRSEPHVKGDRLTFTQFLALAQDGRVRNATILDQDAYVVGRYVPGGDGSATPAQLPQTGMGALNLPAQNPAAVTGPTRPYAVAYLRAQNTREQLVQVLVSNGVAFTINQQNGKGLSQQLLLLIPLLMLVAVILYLVISHQQGTGLFGVRSGARKVVGEQSGVTFADVAGQAAAVAELRELVEFVRDPNRFTVVGAAIPKGILLYGPPGCGKTLMARALAGESGATFYSISGSDFVELYVGVGAARVRDLFTEARITAPSIVFIDELDSVGRRRGSSSVGQGSREEQEQALNQILAEMDGFSASSGVIVIGATNRPDVLDPALLRPGRFDRSIGLERPDEAGRLAILRVHSATKSLGPDVDLAKTADKALGLSGADLANVMNEAALLAARDRKTAITQRELDVALLRVLEAPERQRRLSMRDRSVGRRHVAHEGRTTFADVAGVEEVVDEMAEIRQYLADPERFARMGARVPRGILMDGPPGCGKTLLARALAGEANAAFVYLAGSELTELFVGEGAARVRDLFSDARAMAPAIVFIDEIDAIGARRSVVPDGQREREQTLNQILVELDGFEPRAGVITVAATNRPDILDPALVRPGRFDRRVTIGLPSLQPRKAILALHARNKPLSRDVDLDTVARLTHGFSGADLANVLNEAVLLASRRGRDYVPMAFVEEAIERAILGVSPASRIVSERERWRIAFHETGHAIVARALPGAPTPHRLTIIPRGTVLGATWSLGAGETIDSRSVLLDRMAADLGGRAAEQVVFGEPSSGAADDLARVSSAARRMVAELGMSEALGLVVYVDDGSAGGLKGHSERAAALIDSEVRDLTDQAYQRALHVVESNRPALDAVAGLLFEREVLTAAEFEDIASRHTLLPAGRSSSVGQPSTAGR